MQKVGVTLYRLLGCGSPVTRAQLALACELSQEQTDQCLGEFPPTSLEVDPRGDVVAFGGLSLLPTRHAFIASGTELHTWCVLDALFLPEILGKAAVLATQCPASGATFIVELEPGKLGAAHPPGSVMSVIAPDRAACCADLRRSFCDHISLFRDREAFAAWSRGRTDVECLTLEEAQLLACQRNALRYPDIELGP